MCSSEHNLLRRQAHIVVRAHHTAVGTAIANQDDIALNAKILDDKDSFEVPEVEEKAKPTPEQVEENKTKWDYAG